MPLSFQQHTANGSTSVFDASQIDGYLSTGHIYVFVNDVQKTAGVHYTLQTSPSLQVTFNPAHIPAFKDEVRIQRLTPNTVADRVVDFADGSVLTASDLDQSALQSLFITQEAEDTGSGALGKSFDQLSWNAEGLPVENSATGASSASLATKGYVDNLALYGTAIVFPQSWTFSGDGVQDLFTLSPVANATNTSLFIVEVDGVILKPSQYSFPTPSQIQLNVVPLLGTDNVVVRNFGVSRNVNESVSTAMLQNGSVTEPKIASDAVTTTKILNANVTAAKLASNSVETAKIVDLNVTTGKINDLAVTTGKIAAGAVTSAKLDTNISVTGTLSVGTNATIGGTLGVTGVLTPSGGMGASVVNAYHSPNPVSGTIAAEYIGLPSWTKRIVVTFAYLNINANGLFMVQIGAGSYPASGYATKGVMPGITWGNLANGFVVGGGATSIVANGDYTGSLTLNRMSSDGGVWHGSGEIFRHDADSYGSFSGWYSPVPSTGMIDRIRFTTLSGTALFGPGVVSFHWE